MTWLPTKPEAPVTRTVDMARHPSGGSVVPERAGRARWRHCAAISGMTARLAAVAASSRASASASSPASPATAAGRSPAGSASAWARRRDAR